MHNQACKDRMASELAKTSAGRVRIAAATQRLDRTIQELGEQYRSDVPQGEKEQMAQPHSDRMAPTKSQSEFLPMDSGVGNYLRQYR